MSIFSYLFPKNPSNRTVIPAIEPRATLSLAGKLDSSQAPRVAIYPPVDPGLPAVSVDEILHGAQKKIERLAEIAGGTGSEFERLYLGPLRNLAGQVHLLPATPHLHYSAPAGLFNMCLDIGLMARQAAEGKIFVPEATIEVRHRTEGAWRYSAFLAGLLCQLYVPVGSLTVADANGAQWPRYGSSIVDWLKQNNLDRYFVTWHEKARVTGAEGASLLSSVVPGEVMNWLASADSQIIRDLNIAVTREMNASESILGAIVRSVTNRVKEVDAAQQPLRYGRLTVGTQFEVHILNAMRELIEQKTWTLNEPECNVYWGSDGLYIAWPRGLPDVVEVFNRRDLRGMPRSSVTLAELLGLSGIVISKDAGVWVHDIVVTSKNGEPKVVSAMRFKDPVSLIGHLPLHAVTHPFGKVLVDAQVEQVALMVQNRIEPTLPPAKQPPELITKVDSERIPISTNPLGATIEKVEKVERSEQEKTQIGVALLDHVEESPPGKRVPPEVLVRLRLKDSDDAATALGMAVEQSLNYRGDRVKTLEWGVAICTVWLTQVAGFDVPCLVSPLDRAGVLAKNPESRNVALISDVVFSDSPKPRKALAIKLDFAARLGMAIDAKV